MEFNISNLIMSITADNQNPLSLINALATVLLAIYAYMQWRVAEKQSQTELFKIRMSHYQKLQNLLEKFKKIFPYGKDKEDNTFKINEDKIKKTDKNLKDCEGLLFELDYLKTESRYLFNKKVQEFEEEFYDILRNAKRLVDKKEMADFTDSFKRKFSLFAEKTTNRLEAFDNDLSFFRKKLHRWI